MIEGVPKAALMAAVGRARPVSAINRPHPIYVSLRHGTHPLGFSPPCEQAHAHSMLALVDLGTWVGPPGGILDPVGGTPWGGGWCSHSGPARGRSVFTFPSWGHARIWPDSATFVEFSLSRLWEPPRSASRASLGPWGGARHACVSRRPVGG
jgi:hypothetical protein